MRKPSRLPFYGITLLTLLGVVWGSGYALAKFAITQGVPPLGYAFWQSAGPALFLSCYALRRGTRFNFNNHLPIGFLLVLGTLGVCIPNTTMYIVSPHLPAGVLAVVVNTVPLFTYAIALASGEERFSQARLSAVLFAVIGLLLVQFPSGNQLFHFNHWVIMALISPFCFALTAVIIARSNTPFRSVTMAAGMMLAATAVLSPVVWGAKQFYWPQGFQMRDAAILLEIVLSSIGYVIFFELLSVSGAVYYTFVGGIVAIMGVIWGQCVFQEHIALIDIAGIVIIILSTAWISWLQPRSGDKKKS